MFEIIVNKIGYDLWQCILIEKKPVTAFLHLRINLSSLSIDKSTSTKENVFLCLRAHSETLHPRELIRDRRVPVCTVFRLLTDFVCLYTYEFWLSLCKIVRSSVILLLSLFAWYQRIQRNTSRSKVADWLIFNSKEKQIVYMTTGRRYSSNV